MVGQGRVRRAGEEGRGAVPRELQEVRGAGVRGSPRRRPEDLRPLRERDVPTLAFEGRAAPAGAEVFTLASLYARGERGELGHAIEAPQRPRFHTIYVGTSGRGRLVVDFTPVAIGAGVVTVVAGNRVQAFEPQRRGDALMLLVSPELVDRAYAVLSPTGDPPVLRLGQEHATVRREVEAIGAESDRAIVEALVRVVLLRLERRMTPAPTGAVAKFLTIVERDFARTRSVAYYARQVGLSPRRLGELVQAQLGRSSKQIVDDRVVLELQRMLAHTTLSVKELATALGFEEPTNLVKFFRERAGITPIEFRRKVSSGRAS